MNQKQELPEWVGYGDDFNYAQWTANTFVSLHNVPWDNSYRDIVYFDRGQNELNEYLDNMAGPQIRIPSVTYHRPGQSIKLQIPFGKALGFNYLRAYNYPQPGQAGDVGRYYYYFVAAVNHINPSTTEFILQLDVVQSYIYDVRFGSCYIQQGHIGIANGNAFADNGRDYLTIPEGLDVGGEYEIATVHRRNIASARNDMDGYSIMVVSTVALDEEPGTVEEPSLKSATGNMLENLPNGTETYLFNSIVDWNAFLARWSDKPWITQGIISITAIPKDVEKTYGLLTQDKKVNGEVIREVKGGTLNTVRNRLSDKWREPIRNMLPTKYRHLDKFLTFPYLMVELTASTGTPLVLKPESIGGDDLDVIEVPHFAQPSPRIMFYPFRYNAKSESQPITDATGVMHDGGEHLDMATGIFNFPTFALVNNAYLAFMASNANSISFQHSSADWSQQRALAGNDLAAHQATAGIGLSQNLSSMSIDASRQQTTLNQQTAIMQGTLGAANGILGAKSAGQAVGSIANAAVSTAIGINQSEQSYGISSNLARGQNVAQTGNMGYNRDTNKDYADYAAKGDYQNTIAGINAKVQDARLTQPTTSGQVGGDAFLLSQYYWGYDAKIKMLQGAAIARIGDYWLRYGYAVQRFSTVPWNLKVMSHFTYWKLSETYLTGGNMPETFRGTIRGIFEKGVTVWTKPEYVGKMQELDNQPLNGVYL